MVEIGQLDIHVDERGVDLEDLFVDRDRLQEEALLGIELRNLAVGLGGSRVVTDAGFEVSDLEEGADVLGVFLDAALEFLDRLVDLPLLQELLRVSAYLVLVGGHAELGYVPLRTIARCLRWLQCPVRGREGGGSTDQ